MEMTTEQKIRGVFHGIREQATCNTKGFDINGIADTALVAYATNAMKLKLAEAAKKGRGGWWDEGQCQIEHLEEMLSEHVKKGDMRDVMNIAAMIYVRRIVDA